MEMVPLDRRGGGWSAPPSSGMTCRRSAVKMLRMSTATGKILPSRSTVRPFAWLVSLLLALAVLGGVANAAAAVGNPVGSLLGLSEQSYNVAYRDGAGAGIAYGVGSVIGATQLTQAVIGQNFATGQALSGLDRWGMAAQGVSAASGTAALSLGVSGYNPAVFGGTAGTASIMSAPITGSPVTWVEETTGMSSAAEDYGAGATGARSNLISGYRQLPQLGYMRADGSLQMVRFDGYENNVLIDRKLGVVDSPRGYEEAIRQSTALLEHGLTGRWEVPNAREAATAVKMFNNVGITNISVRIVPP